MEHFYRATTGPWLDDVQWARLPATVRRSSLLRTLTEILEHAATAGGEGGLDGPETHVSRAELALDGQGITQITALLATTRETALGITAESAARHHLGAPDISRDISPTITTELAILHFRHRDDEERACLVKRSRRSLWTSSERLMLQAGGARIAWAKRP